MYATTATLNRKKGDSIFKRMKRCFPKRRVESIPPIMNVATRMRIARLFFVFRIWKKINKLIADIIAITETINAINTSLYPSNRYVALLLSACETKTSCE